MRKWLESRRAVVVSADDLTEIIRFLDRTPSCTGGF